MAYILTKDDLAKTAVERFRKQYERHNSHSKSAMETYESIKCETDPDSLAGLLHKSWLNPRCDSCGEYVEAVLVFDVNCGEYDFSVCRECCETPWTGVGTPR